MKCKYCGEEIAENDTFCKICVESYKANEKSKIVINQAMPKGWKSKPKFVHQTSAPTLPKKQSSIPPFIARLIGIIGAGFIFGLMMYFVQALR